MNEPVSATPTLCAVEISLMVTLRLLKLSSFVLQTVGEVTSGAGCRHERGAESHGHKAWSGTGDLRL